MNFSSYEINMDNFGPEPVSYSPNYENKLNRIESRPLSQNSTEGFFALRGRCVKQIFILLYKDVLGEVSDLAHMAQATAKSAYPALFGDSAESEKYFVESLDYLGSAYMRPFALLTDVAKLVVGILIPAAAIRPSSVSGEHPIRHPQVPHMNSPSPQSGILILEDSTNDSTGEIEIPNPSHYRVFEESENKTLADAWAIQPDERTEEEKRGGNGAKGSQKGIRL